MFCIPINDLKIVFGYLLRQLRSELSKYRHFQFSKPIFDDINLPNHPKNEFCIKNLDLGEQVLKLLNFVDLQKKIFCKNVSYLLQL